jgi:membrane-bound metal-dependent hydrolase YbcI (DUF457 family)
VATLEQRKHDDVITGHFGLAAGAKSADTRAPLWGLMVATMWLDIVFVPLLVLDIETIDTPADGGYGTSIIHADYTHSLVGAVVLSAIFGLLARYRWGRQVGLLLGAVAFSHWILDLIVHRADMPILPGDAGDLPKLGLGLWRNPAASILLEAALLVAGTYLYWRAASRNVDSAPTGTRVTPGLVTGVIFGSGALVLLLDALGI